MRISEIFSHWQCVKIQAPVTCDAFAIDTKGREKCNIQWYIPKLKQEWDRRACNCEVGTSTKDHQCRNCIGNRVCFGVYSTLGSYLHLQIFGSEDWFDVGFLPVDQLLLKLARHRHLDYGSVHENIPSRNNRLLWTFSISVITTNFVTTTTPSTVDHDPRWTSIR